MLVLAGELIPADGDVTEGAASVDESAITGESAPVIRESGGDRSAVTGGTTVLSDWLVLRVTSEVGRSFLDRMIAMLGVLGVSILTAGPWYGVTASVAGVALFDFLFVEPRFSFTVYDMSASTYWR